ncbi:S8 family serine peptidase [Virgisporangium ochraceum]|uniref:Peptidase n=1 Tax=Virgisporangium ochraceum TaxID=65505 RepID=A0A8J3ZXA0_9ACTN|nr:S8 family serine peptidase [Virgisporangium ochraceum]GIJ71759.1 peptidase [Virgisporangium ochraceum]
MRNRRFVARATAVAVFAAVAVSATAAAPPGTAGAAPPSGVSRGAQGPWVTLITGDRVLVGASVVVDPVDRVRPARFQQFTRRGDRYVVPSDAGPLVRAGRLDLELFNVTGLVRQGYDDARASTLPLLVRYSGAAPATRAAPGGAAVRRVLPGSRMAAVDARKSAAGRVLADLAGVERVWLNAKARVTLDGSVSRIGAPAAWAQGVTGRGVTVAVLDTGVDTDHPDLAGKVSLSRDFSGKGSVEDGNGHGTHVASTVAGSGAASGGRYRGVAPDASLAVGKVLDDTGSGSFDAIIAGLEWAAAEAHADVVNLSLGAYGSDGTDPVSAAVDDLTRRYGTLFVAATGNDGADGWVSTPAAATSALAVGSVSKVDVPSPFSNRGPRAGDGAVKPEIAAPGEGIVAAAPAGVPPLGEPVGDGYQRLDGTSMATPHLAGAAALVVQQHPDWTPTQVKDALVSTAAEVAGAGVYAVGTGRVDAARATGQTLTATGTVSVYLKWPTAGASRTERVTWRNSGAAPVTLTLDAALTRRDGAPAPARTLTLSARTVTVPAGGTSTVDLTVSAVDGAAGTYGGVLVARGGDGSLTRTALSVHQEEELYDLTVTLVNRDGQAPPDDGRPTVVIFDLDDSGFFYWGAPGTARLPAGRYAVHTIIETPRTGREPSVSFISHPELRLDRDVAQTFDARDGKPASVTPDNPAARGGAYQVQLMGRIADCDCTSSVLSLFDPRFSEVYAATVPGTGSPTYAFGQSLRALEPAVEILAADPADGGAGGFEVAAGWLDGPPATAEQATLPMVYGGRATPADLSGVDATGKVVLAELPGDLSREEVYRRAENIRATGARLALVTVPSNGDATTARTRDDEPRPALPTLVAQGPTAARLAALVKAAPTTVRYTSRPASSLRYELAYGVQGRVTTAQQHRPRSSDLAAVRTAYHENVAGAVRYVNAAVGFFGTELGNGWSVPVTAGVERVEYFTPGRWQLMSGGSGGPRDTLSETIDLAARRTYRVGWNAAVAGPWIRGTVLTPDGERPWAWRDRDAIDVLLPLYADAAGHPRVPFPDDGTDTGSISLYRDGELVGTAPVPDRARFEVPPAPGTYRLVAATTRAVDWWPRWTTVSAAWTFPSSAAGNGNPLPLPTARLVPDVDVRNRAPGGRAFTVPVHVSTAARTVTVDVSYDDGRTWHRAAVSGSGDRWTASVHHPRTGHASFRTTVVDTAGNRLEQTVIRAYGLD